MALGGSGVRVRVRVRAPLKYQGQHQTGSPVNRAGGKQNFQRSQWLPN